MYRMIIADDEKEIREGISRMLIWEDYGIQIAGMAEDGEEALRQIMEFHPEILITDIRMPKMDGLELISRALLAKEPCKIIVLSGYNDFELVHQAMKLGVADYLLKPSSKQEMAKAIEEILDSLSDKIISRYDNREHFELLKNNVMNRILQGTITSRELRSRLDFLELDFDEYCFAAAVVQCMTGEEETRKQEQVIDIFRVCEEMLEESGLGIVFTDHQSRTVVFFREKHISVDFEREKDILYQCIRRINRELHMNVSVSMGDSCDSHRQLAKSYAQAVKMLEYQYVFGQNVVLLYTEIEQYLAGDSYHPQVDLQEFSDCMRSGKLQEWQACVEKVFGRFGGGEKFYDPFAIRNASLEILFRIFERFESYPLWDRNRIMRMKYEALNEISEKTTVEGMKKVLMGVGEALLVEKTYSRTVKYVLDYVEKHYDDSNLSLAFLAELLQVNTAYLGRVFKKEYQCSFNDYLNLYRIEKAKELLRNTTYKGMEICEMVGFVNYNYFYIIFKKITGKSPSEYRREK